MAEIKPISDSLAENSDLELETARNGAFYVTLNTSDHEDINTTKLVPAIKVLLFDLFPNISSKKVCRYLGGQIVMYNGDYPQNGYDVIIQQFGGDGDTDYTSDYDYKSGTCLLNIENFKKAALDEHFYGNVEKQIVLPAKDGLDITYLKCILESIGAKKGVNKGKVSYTTTMKQLRDAFISECEAINALVAPQKIIGSR